jgi:hypothetical protein
MNLDQINSKFKELVFTYGIHQNLNINSGRVRNYRQYLSKGQRISLDLKIKLLQRAGYTVMSEPGYTRADLVDLVEFVHKQGTALDPAYAVEKFLTIKANAGTPPEHVGDMLLPVIKRAQQGMLFK